MGKKQKNKEKQIIKKKEKEKREVIINSYITKVKALLEDAYVNMAVIIEEFNEIVYMVNSIGFVILLLEILFYDNN